MSEDERREKPEVAGAPESSSSALLVRALESIGGGVIVLDASLRVVAATAHAGRLLGAPIRRGAHAVRVLCGSSADSPIAEALSSGVPVLTWVPRISGSGEERRVRVRAARLEAKGRIDGWIVRLAPEPSRADDHPHQFGAMWTRDSALEQIFAVAQAVAGSGASLSIEGEAGTGKASLARAIHALAPDGSEPLRMVTCAQASPAVLERLIAGEASTGQARTLFLDEVTELPHDAQGYLLRVIESGSVTPLSGGRPVEVMLRTLSASRTPMERAAEEGRFRSDLMYRLRTLTFRLPPLRARRGDVRLLVETKLAELARGGEREVTEVEPAAWASLLAHTWPGNVRELCVAIERAYVLGTGNVLRKEDLPRDVTDPLTSPLERTIHPRAAADDEPSEAMRIHRALDRAAGDRERAAAMLGISRSTLWRRMRELGVTRRRRSS